LNALDKNDKEKCSNYLLVSAEIGGYFIIREHNTASNHHVVHRMVELKKKRQEIILKNNTKLKIKM
jgi:hypothetical protein